MAASDNGALRSLILPGEGVTAAERYLARLCKRSFLSLWSYPAVFRDQGRPGGKGDGKEVCDLLVVFQNNVIIFSDKDCEFRGTGNLQTEWCRWYKKAILKSVVQVFGAERWIKGFPNRLFLDRRCRVPFPIALPNPDRTTFHRVVVAHNGARRCREALGGTGSLMMDTSVVGNVHSRFPFTIGQIDPDKGYVHVLDDTTLDLVMNTLDTITDFTAYLTKKEQFLTGDKVVWAAGEEELLAIYLTKLNQAGEHDFVIKGNYDRLSSYEGFWEKFVSSPERRAQVDHNRISYSWDRLIENFTFHAMTGTQYISSGQPLKEQEIVFRLMAREPRTRRRMLAVSIHEVLKRSVTSGSAWDTRVIAPSHPGDPHYVFLAARRAPGVSYEEYREVRLQLLSDYCYIARFKWPEASDIIGIATESGASQKRSHDLIYLNAENWDADAETHAKETQQRLGLLNQAKPSFGREHEYPVDYTGCERETTILRNSPCRCGSGKRFKRCCGRGLFDN
jgi:SEC-C motif-containing protein